MRLWLAEHERRPDPEPARADARKAVLAGTIAWVVSLAACLIWNDALRDAGLAWLALASAIGAGIGVIGLLVVQVLRARERQGR